MFLRNISRGGRLCKEQIKSDQTNLYHYYMKKRRQITVSS
nr:MAG TPA: hypothetical protein [Caudoviricetes sp.]DAZ03408.1 MAG TPA: hypothetical protein [Caudoviricetes sp.]